MGTVLTVGNSYYSNTDTLKRVIKVVEIKQISSSSYCLHFGGAQVVVNMRDVLDIKYLDNTNTIIEMTLNTNDFTEVQNTPPATGPKFYTKNRILKAMDSDGIEFDLNKENINLVWKWRGNNDWYQPIDYNNKETDCSHEWVTTVGFSSEYIDCSKCGAKKEEV